MKGRQIVKRTRLIIFTVPQTKANVGILARIFVLIAGILIGAEPVFSQSTVDPDGADSTLIVHDDVLITARLTRTTPVTFQNITGRELDRQSVGQEPSAILAATPSITAYSDAGNTQGYSYFRLRGIDQTRINISLDGVPMNEPEDQGAYFSNYPDLLNSVSSLQIQRGVGTSQNGVASYGGSIQLYSPEAIQQNKSTLGFGYGSFNSLRAFSETELVSKNGLGLHVRGSEIYSSGYKKHSGNHSQSVFVSGMKEIGRSEWKLNLLAGHQQNQMAWLGVRDSLIAIDRRTNANSDENDQFLQTMAHLRHRYKLTANSQLSTNVYHTFLKGNYDFDFNNFLGLPSTNEMYNYAFQSQLIGFFSNYAVVKGKWNWVSGLHFNAYQRTHTGSERSLGELYSNRGAKTEASLFSKAEYSLKWATLFADVQYRYAVFGYKGAVKMDPIAWHFVNPKAGISVPLRHNMNAYYSVGSTGREPTRNDMFGGNDDLLADSLGNPMLSIVKAERVLDHELGIRRSKGLLQYALNGYYMGFRNEIVLNGKFGPNGLALTDSVERSFRAGAELMVQVLLNDHFLLTNNSSWNYSRIRASSTEFSPILTPSLIVNQEVEYHSKNFSVALGGRVQSSAWIDFANTTKIQPYFLLNARAHYQIKALRLSVFANNLTNAKYYNNGYVDFDGSKKYFVQSPINFYGAAQYTF